MIKAQNNDVADHAVIPGTPGDFSAREIAPHFDWSALHGEAEHIVSFYEAEAFLLQSLCRFIGTGLTAGEAIIVVATPSHHQDLEELSQAAGLDLGPARTSGQYVPLDAGEVLSRFMADGWPDPRSFMEFFGGIITRAAQGWRRVRIFGEMVALLWAEQSYAAALCLEELWNQLHELHPFLLFCAYPIHGFGRESLAAALHDVCAAHTRVIPAESYTALESPDDRLRTIIQLQQKAQSLEAEVAKREAIETMLRAVKEELEVQVEDLRRLHELSMRLTSTLDIEAVLHEVLQAALAVQGTPFGLLWLDDPQHNSLVLKASNGLEPVFLDQVALVRPGVGAYGACYAGRRRIVVEDVEVDPIFTPHRAAAQHVGIRACHSAPLIPRSGTIIGVLAMHFPTPHRPSERETRLLELYAQTAANVIENARLHQQVQHELAAHEQLLAREQAARADAERANRLKDQFLSLAAHELRTPLTTLMGQAQLFQRRTEREGSLPERDRRTLRIINEQVARLNKLVLAFLDVSRLEMGQLMIERVPLDLCALVRRVVGETASAADDRRIELVCPDTPILINGDALRLEQVLQNLLQNALKYSWAPEPVTVTVMAHTAKGCVAVQDRGIGIPHHAFPHLFERFYRVQNAEELHISGMGIGLYVVKEIVTLHGGSVAVESSEGDGSTFTVCLPLAEEHMPA